VGLRADGSVVVWDPTGLVSAPPAGVVFKEIAAGNGFAVGIDDAGHLHGWADPLRAPFTAVPAGVYSAVSAAITR
jgi:hypothetical protein